MRTELVTSLKRRATAIIAALEERPEPILITQYGLPAAYLVDVATYERLKERLAVLEGIARGERAISEGRVIPHRAARKRMAKWLS
jgi:prevent-host-death family protein